jgi:nucleoside-diphosphate-sugar epimerase
VILVTGATGFLGRNLCPYLVERGHRLRALVRTSSDVAFLRGLGVELVYGDVRDPDAALRAVQGCRRVIHAAGKFRFWGRYRDFFATNVQGTANILAAAARFQVERLIYVSTIAVVGAPRADQVLDESVRCTPQDEYQQTKLEAEALVLSYHRERRLPVIVLRPGAYYGPWGRYAFNRMFFEDPLKGLPMGVHHGKRITFPIFVPDLVRVIEAGLTQGQEGQIYNVSGPSMTHAQVHETVSCLAGLRTWRVNPPGFALVWLARLWTFVSRFTKREPYYSVNMVPYVFCDWDTNSDKARQELGFIPTSFKEGARQTLAWYRQQGIGPTNWLGRLVVRLWQKRDWHGDCEARSPTGNHDALLSSLPPRARGVEPLALSAGIGEPDFQDQ